MTKNKSYYMDLAERRFEGLLTAAEELDTPIILQVAESRLQTTPRIPITALSVACVRLPRMTRHSHRSIWRTVYLLSGLCNRSSIFISHFSLFTSHLTSAPHIIFSRSIEKYSLPLRFTT